MVVLFDRYNLPEDINEIKLATDQQRIVAKLLIQELKIHSGELTKTEMSLFATRLHEGKLITQIDEPAYRGRKVKISYNKRQFYDRILTPMKSMGLIDYDMYKKTYRISEKFQNSMSRIGIMWAQEVKKSAYNIKR